MSAPICRRRKGVQRLRTARCGHRLVLQGRADHGADADERVGADEQHQSGHRARRAARHPAHPRVTAVLLLTHHQNLRHRGKLFGLFLAFDH